MAQSYRDYMDIGSDLLLSGSFAKSIEMFDKALEANSKVLPYLWQRGLAYYFAERYDEGAKQFEVDMTVNGADVEETVWRFLCIAASRSFDQVMICCYDFNDHDNIALCRINQSPKCFNPSESPDQFLINFPIIGSRNNFGANRTDKRVPMLQVYNLFAGKGSIEDIHKETDKLPDSALKNRTKFYGYYYIGLYYEAMRNKEAAIENIKKSLTFEYNDYMVALARVHLQKLTDQL